MLHLTYMALLVSSFNFISTGLENGNFGPFTNSIAIPRVLFDLGIEKIYSG